MTLDSRSLPCPLLGRRGGLPSWLGLLLVVVGCGQDTTGPAPRDPATLPWSVSLNTHAVTLSDSAPYDTVQLLATLRTETGTPLPGAVVRYTSTDPSSAVVDTTGLVTAVGVTNLVRIVASATLAGVTVSDTVRVQVNDVGAAPLRPTHLVLTATQNPLAPIYEPTPPPNEGLTMDCMGNIVNGNSSFYAIATTRYVQLSVQVLAANGTDLSNTTFVDYRSSAPDLVQVLLDNQGNLNKLIADCRTGLTGHVTLTATATVYGVSLRDAVQLQVIPPLRNVVNILARTPRATGQLVHYFDPGTVTIGVGGRVLWYASSDFLPDTALTDVVFDVPSPTAVAAAVDSATVPLFEWYNYRLHLDAPGGNIAAFRATDTMQVSTVQFRAVGSRARQFPIAGTYHYHSARYGTAGTIIVRPWTP